MTNDRSNQETHTEINEAGTGGAEQNGQPKRGLASRARRDKDRLHATRHGMLAKSPLQSLADRGENIRQIRRIERLLRIELRPIGVIGEILFDRLFSSYLRCVLMARAEAEFVFPLEPITASDQRPTLRQGHLPTLVFPETNAAMNHFSGELLGHLAIVRKYDAHYSREFYRALGLLVSFGSGGSDGLARNLGKSFAPNRGSRDTADE